MKSIQKNYFMKKLFIIIVLLQISVANFAQEEEVTTEKSGFKKENIFVGGTIALGFGGGGNNRSFVIGANPEIGYSLAKWLDAGIVFNVIFNSNKFVDGSFRYKQNAFNYGAGIFTRIHPINNFFIQAQPEYNWIDYTQTNLDLAGSPKIKQTVQAASFLVGVGYGQRIIGQSSFFTVLMFDLATEKNSPYRDAFGASLPIIRGGFNIYLKPKKQK